MAKRAAAQQITQDTLDHEDEPEDAGRFEKATESELEGRVYKKARRTRLGDAMSTDQSDSSRPGLFSGIRLTGSLTQQQNGIATKPAPPSSSSSSSSSFVNFNPRGAGSNGNVPPAHSSGLSSTTTTAVKPTFLSELRNLNTSVNDWISKHVRENPYVDLTPIFRDYKSHLEKLDAKFGSSGGTQNDITEQRSEVVAISNVTGEKGGEEMEEEEGGERKGEKKEFNLVSLNGEDKGEAAEEEEEKEEEGGGGGGGGGEKSGTSETSAADKEEKESLHSVRAKLYFKRSTSTEFTELGLGQLRVLPCGDDAVKVVMRNDTSLAKVLLNVRVSSGVPVSLAKNNVMLVTVPNPPLPQKSNEKIDGEAPVTYLIRVKNVAKATELQQALQSTPSDN